MHDHRAFLVSCSLVVAAFALGPAVIRAETVGGPTPAAEATAALERLRSTTYRQRDIVSVPIPAMRGALPATITEHAGDRSRLVSEMTLPEAGTIRSERISIGSRAAVRTTAPVLLAKLEQAKTRLTVSSAKSLLQQIVSAASALQTGGLTAASWISEAIRAASTLKSTAEARVALDRAMAGFESWQPVVEDDELASLPMPPEGSEEEMTVEKSLDARGATISYRRTPATAMAAGMYSILYVDAKTGYPVAEESFINGQKMMRSEFFDIGAAISIELPTCLQGQ